LKSDYDWCFFELRRLDQLRLQGVAASSDKDSAHDNAKQNTGAKPPASAHQPATRDADGILDSNVIVSKLVKQTNRHIIGFVLDQ